MRPPLVGISHIVFTVTDVAAGRRFWTEVMGLQTVAENPGFCMLVSRELRMAIGLKDHDGTAGGPFSEKHVGLDHLSFDVGDLPSLQAWERRLAEHQVPFTPIITSDWGHHLNLRAPEAVPIELFAVRVAPVGLPAGLLA